MIGSVDEAWRWYQASRDLSRVMARLGGKYWDQLPRESALGRDNSLRLLEATEIEEMSDAVLSDLDDLCVLLLFSVFEDNS